MNKTLIATTLLALGSMAASAQLTDPDYIYDMKDPFYDEEDGLNRQSYTQSDNSYTKPYTLTAAEGYALKGTWKSDPLSDYIGANSTDVEATVSLKLSDLVAGQAYDVFLVTGRSDGITAGFDGLAIYNDYTYSDVDLNVTGTIQGYTTFEITRVIADDNGEINFSIMKDAAGHTAMFNYVEIKESAALVPEPTTATLSLLALAGLAARRRRR